MPTEPWHQAAESREDSRSQMLQAGAEQSGLASAAGILAVGILGPMAAKRGARKAVSAVGRQSDDALQKIQQRADEAAEDVSGLRQKIQRYSKSTTERARAAAARASQRAKKQGGKIDLSKFAADVGYEGFERSRRLSQRYKQFKQRAKAEGESVIGRFLSRNRRGQRRLAASAGQKVKRELAVEGPGMFAVDYAFGVTQSPGERHAAYDVMGHTQEAVEYLPTFAAYETLGRGAMLAVPDAARVGMRAAKEFLQESDTAAKAVSKTFSAMEGAKRGAQRVSGEIQDRYRQHVAPRPNSMETAREAMRQSKQFLRRQGERAASSMEKYLAGQSGGRARDPTSHSKSLQGAQELVGDPTESQKGSPFVQQVMNAGESMSGLKRAMDRLTVGQDRTPQDPITRALGGKAATIKEVRESGNITLSEQGQKSLQQLEKRIEKAKSFIEEQPDQVSGPAKEVAERLKFEDLRASGYAKIGGKVRRTPTAGDMRRMVGGALDRATRLYLPGTERDGSSIFEILGGKNLQKVRPAVRPMKGGIDVKGDLMYFGKGAPAQADQVANRGLAVMDYPGAMTGKFYGDGTQMTPTGTPEGESMFISPRTTSGGSKMHTLRMRRHYSADTTREEAVQRRQGGPPDPEESFGRTILGSMYGKFQLAKKKLSLGKYQGENTAYQRIKSSLGGASPRRLFAEDSDLWSASLARDTGQGATPVADAVFVTRQALRNGTDAYTTPEMFDKAAGNALPDETIEKLGGTDAILKDREKTLKAAEDLLQNMPTEEGLKAPSASEARKIVQESKGNLDRLYNAHGRPRAQTLRRFIAEQGALGTSPGSGALEDMKGMLGDLEKRGKLSPRAAREARAGLVNLDIQKEAGEQLKNPYQALSETTGERSISQTLGAAQSALRKNREALEEFGQSRDRVDLSYHRKAFTEPDYFGTPFQETGSFAMEASPMSAGKLLAESGLETTRRALSSVGMGWNPNVSLSAEGGLKKVGKIWAKRGAAVVGGALAYRAADTGVDAALPEDAPFGEGLTMAGADIAANAAMAASKTYDALGITGAAQYMEGLMPKSTSTLPGAAAGYYAAGPMGAIAGAAVNRATQTTLKNTPLEGLAIAPPLAPFVSDMTESYEQTKAEYQGRKWVPQRKGRFFMLSSTPYAGERIESYRPNWYTRQKSQYKETPVLYGSKTEAAIFKDLPLIDFAPGDILDPQYLMKTNRESRPYHEPSVPFSEIPIIGPSVGARVGKMYNFVHPMASNRPRHMEDVVGSFEGEDVGHAPDQIGGQYPSAAVGTPASGYQSFGQGGAQTNAPGGESAYVEGQTIVGGSSPSATLDEQFYRLSEAMGFTGFVGQQAVGGEGIFRRPRYKSASRMDSTARAFHDLKMGDMLGVGEAVRRLYPFERGGETAQGPRNQMAQWMPGEDANVNYRRGDPYCVSWDTPIEMDGEMVPAEEAYEILKEEPFQHKTRTHRNNERTIAQIAKRRVDEEIVDIDVEGLPWTLKVTEGHPILVYESGDLEWVLAGDLEEGDKVVEPTDAKGEPDRGTEWTRAEAHQDPTGEWTRQKDGVMMEALHALMKIEPPPGEYFWTHGLDERDRLMLNRAFGLPGSRYERREKREIATLRREIAEEGIPKGLEGINPGTVAVLVRPWVEEVSEERGSVRLTLTPEKLGRKEREAWAMRKPYEPERSGEEMIRVAAYRLMRILREAGLAAHLSFPEDECAEIELRGRHAARLMFNQKRRREVQSDSPIRNFYGFDIGHHRHTAATREVESIERERYEGLVYNFEVTAGHSFVAGGIATHNSKIAMGEALLPGAGIEATGAVGYGKAALEAEDVGRDTYGTALRMLGIKGREPSDRQKWAKKQAQKRFIDSGAAVRTEAVFVDEEKKVTAVADAATQGNNPIHIKALSKAEFRKVNQPRELDTMQMNAMLGAADQSKGMIAYVNAESGEMRTFTQRFDSSLYNKTVRKMQSARSLAKRYAAKGYGAKGAMYSPTDRLRVLMNADPFGDQWQVEYKKAEALYASGEMAPRARREFEKIARNHDKMRLPFEMYPDRFGSAKKVMNPPEKQANLSYNEHVKSAAQYSLPERAAGAAWKSITSVRTPLHTKFFGNYNMQEQYERRVLLDRDYQSWGQPVDDFVKPYMRGLAAADDPLQGALSYGIGGATFGGPAFGAIGAITGSVYGAGRGAYESATDSTYVPEEKEELRKVSRQFDRMKYHRAKRLYDATGAQKYREQMQNTAVGWTRQGLSGQGWAKSRRRSYSPEERMDSPLFKGDQGFSSPYRGLSKVDDFADAVIKHDDTALSLGKGVNQMDAMDDMAKASLQSMDDAARAFARPPTKPPPRAAIRASGGPARQAPGGDLIRGLPESGYAGALRSHQTGKAAGSGEGFASPYQGQNPEQAVRYNAEDDPTSDPIPPEMLTAFSAAPKSEKDFVRAGLLTKNPDTQAALLRMASPDFAAMMDVGWNYLHGQDLRGRAMDTDPMRQIDRDLASHPVMGKGADPANYKIRTLQDRGLEASDAGLGWKDQMKRLEQAVVGAQPVSGTMEDPPKNVGPDELRQMIKTTLAQMGIRADVSIEPSSSPTEIHLRQRAS